MADKSRKIVEDVEAALADSHACPFCGLYDGTHQVTCEYLKHKGNVDSERSEKPKKEEKEEKEEPTEGEVDEKEKLLKQMKNR